MGGNFLSEKLENGTFSGLRQFIASLNGLAGIAMIEEKWEEAAEKYREAIRVIEEHKGQIKTDTLQRLHTLTNLAEVIEAGHKGS